MTSTNKPTPRASHLTTPANDSGNRLTPHLLHAEIGALLDPLTATRLRIEGSIADWHVTERIGRGRLSDPDTGAAFKVVIPAWRLRNTIHRPATGQSVEVVGQLRWDLTWGLEIAAEHITPVGTDAAHQERLNYHEQLRHQPSPQHELTLGPVTRIGLICPHGGNAARTDVETIFDQRLPPQVLVIVERIAMGGPNAATDIAKALHKLVTNDCDLIAIVRGGGAASDLAIWDDLATVNRIARCPIPIVTGIGHATNTTGADIVAYQHVPTPTAAALAICDHITKSATQRHHHQPDMQRTTRSRTAPAELIAPVTTTTRQQPPQPGLGGLVPAALLAIAILVLVAIAFLA